jgi:hypothetical protein
VLDVLADRVDARPNLAAVGFQLGFTGPRVPMPPPSRDSSGAGADEAWSR